jgi:hypothetical protein
MKNLSLVNIHNSLMYQSQLFKFVTFTSYLWLSQGTILYAAQDGLISQSNTNICQVNSAAARELLANSSPATALNGNVSININCSGNASGNLQLTLDPSVVHNGRASMRFTSGSGVLSNIDANISANTIIIPISSQGDRIGNGQLRVDITAPSGQLLKSASDYQLVIATVFN